MTADERLNAGFHVWGLTRGLERTLLARVPSANGDSSAPQSYQVRVAAPAGAVGADRGPRRSTGATGCTGRSRSVAPTASAPRRIAIDWDRVRRETGVVSVADRLADAAGVAPLHGRAPRPPRGARSCWSAEEGIHRVTYEELLAAGVDLGGVPTAAHRPLRQRPAGAARRRWRPDVGPRAAFGPGGFIEFLARPRLTLESPADALRAPGRPQVGDDARRAPAWRRNRQAIVTAEHRSHPDRSYSSSSPNGDPWYDARILSFGVSRQRDADASTCPTSPTARSSSTSRSGAAADFDGAAPDHHLVVRLNGTELASARFDGITPWSETLRRHGLVLAAGNTLESAATGEHRLRLRPGPPRGLLGRLPPLVGGPGRPLRCRHGSGGTPSPVAVSPTSEPVVAWSTDPLRESRGPPAPGAGLVQLPALTGEVYLAAERPAASPGGSGRDPDPAAQLRGGVPDHHPPRLRRRRGRPGRARAGPRASPPRWSPPTASSPPTPTTPRRPRPCGDSSPPRSSTAGCATCCWSAPTRSTPTTTSAWARCRSSPRAYLPVGPVVTFSPTDEVLADGDGDGLGEVPVGRLPVRTAAELACGRGQARDLGGARGRAPGTPGGRAPRTTAAACRSSTRPTPTRSGAGTPSWSRSTTLGSAAVRQATLAALNEGVPLVSFVGHSAPGQWDFTPILRWQDVATLTNAGRPNLVTQWGCWNSYAVDPAYRSLSGYLLLAPEVGAAGIIGASTLTTDASHQRLGSLFFDQMNRGAKTVGEACRAAKQTLHGQHAAQDAVLGMCLFGDPAMSLPAAAR